METTNINSSSEQQKGTEF
ncbi:hypothetical protein RDI58_013249 [Solanum bulbocastanum]|uniref:Uncharacterized protein n=1 Tax=Solanum bulbocastanum TaxID=147425 RepID=A0AAN8TLT1_SOLBU